MKIREALAEAAKQLEGISDTARLDAELLMAKALGITRETLLLGTLHDTVPASFDALVERRARSEPIAYITGHRAFWTIELAVGPGALIPRPDSETLIEAACGHFGAKGPKTIIDLGTGPGTLLLAALRQWPQALGVGIDISRIALEQAAGNAQRLGLSGRASFRHGDWAEGINERFDLVLCNPPYVETGANLPRDVAQWEPHEALFAGPDGLDAYRRLAPMIRPLLLPGGIACIEIGAGQEERVRTFITAAGLKANTLNDLSGYARCLILSV